MPFTLAQYVDLQPRITELQRLALHLAECGEPVASLHVQKAAIRLQRIKPTKPVQESIQLNECVPAERMTVQRGKGA